MVIGQESVKIDTMFIGADVTNDTPSAWLCGKAAELVEESRNALYQIELLAGHLPGVGGRTMEPSGTPTTMAYELDR